jgi:hypothetical protein
MVMASLKHPNRVAAALLGLGLMVTFPMAAAAQGPLPDDAQQVLRQTISQLLVLFERYAVAGQVAPARAIQDEVRRLQADVGTNPPYEFAIDETVQGCRHFVLVMGSDWGPPERTFQRDYERACRYLSDPEKAMHDVVCLAPTTSHSKKPSDMPAPLATFSTIEEFKEQIRGLLSAWMAVLLQERGQHAASKSAAQ